MLGGRVDYEITESLDEIWSDEFRCIVRRSGDRPSAPRTFRGSAASADNNLLFLTFGAIFKHFKIHYSEGARCRSATLRSGSITNFAGGSKVKDSERVKDGRTREDGKTWERITCVLCVIHTSGCRIRSGTTRSRSAPFAADINYIHAVNSEHGFDCSNRKLDKRTAQQTDVAT